MNKSTTITLRKAAAVAVASTLGALVGCGDAHVFDLDPGHIDPDSVSSLAVGIDGSEVQLRRYSTGCNTNASDLLTAKVGDGMEFTADQVKALASPCPESPNPAVDVQVEHRTLIFDFSNVEQPGGFPDSEFEGYILDITPDEHGPQLLFAFVDRQQTNMDLHNEDLSYDHEHLEINFAGIAYDSTGFVKVELLFANITPATGSTN